MTTYFAIFNLVLANIVAASGSWFCLLNLAVGIFFAVVAAIENSPRDAARVK